MSDRERLERLEDECRERFLAAEEEGEAARWLNELANVAYWMDQLEDVSC